MSFDLYFYSKKKDTLEKEKLLNYFNDIPRITVNSLENGLTQFMYENEDTSVYFLMDYIEP